MSFNRGHQNQIYVELISAKRQAVITASTPSSIKHKNGIQFDKLARLSLPINVTGRERWWECIQTLYKSLVAAPCFNVPCPWSAWYMNAPLPNLLVFHDNPSGVYQARTVGLIHKNVALVTKLSRVAFMHHADKGQLTLKHWAAHKGLKYKPGARCVRGSAHDCLYLCGGKHGGLFSLWISNEGRRPWELY